MSKTTNEASLARIEASRRLNPAAVEVRARIIAADNKQQTQGLRASYEFAKELQTVKNDADRYGLKGYQDLIDSLGIERTGQKWIAVATYIKPEDIDRYEATQSKEGRVFTKTHLWIIASLVTASDRRKAFDSWVANSYTTREFENYVSELSRAATAADGEEGEGGEDGEDGAEAVPNFSVGKAVEKLQKQAEALLALVIAFDNVDLAVMRLSLPTKHLDALEGATRTLNGIQGILPEFFERLNAVPTPDTSQVVNAADLLNAAKSAPASPQAAPAKKASVKKAATKKPVPKKVPVKKVATKKAATKKAPVKKAAVKKAPAAAKPDPTYQAPKSVKPTAGFKPAERVADAVGSTLAAAPTGPAASRRRGKQPSAKA